MIQAAITGGLTIGLAFAFFRAGRNLVGESALPEPEGDTVAVVTGDWQLAIPTVLSPVVVDPKMAGVVHLRDDLSSVTTVEVIRWDGSLVMRLAGQLELFWLPIAGGILRRVQTPHMRGLLSISKDRSLVEYQYLFPEKGHLWELYILSENDTVSEEQANLIAASFRPRIPASVL